MNLLDIIGNDTKLKKTSGTRGGEYHGACPFCMDGDDRFWVHPHHGDTGVWQCRPGTVCGQAAATLTAMSWRSAGWASARPRRWSTASLWQLGRIPSRLTSIKRRIARCCHHRRTHRRVSGARQMAKIGKRLPQSSWPFHSRKAGKARRCKLNSRSAASRLRSRKRAGSV